MKIKQFVSMMLIASVSAIAMAGELLYSSSFEPDEGFYDGPIEGQAEWTASGEGVSLGGFVQSFTAFQGGSAVMVQSAYLTSAGKWLTPILSPSSNNPIVVIKWVQMRSRTNSGLASLAQTEYGLGIFDENGAPIVRSHTLREANGAGLSSGENPIERSLSELRPDSWQFMSLKLDTASNTAELFVNGRLFTKSVPIGSWPANPRLGFFAADARADDFILDAVHVEAFQAGTVTGTVHGAFADIAGREVTVKALDPDTGALVGTATGFIGGDAKFSIPVNMSGEVQIVVKPKHGLSTEIGTISNGRLGLFDSNVDIVLGDFDENDVIGLGDYLLMVSVFDYTSDDPQWLVPDASGLAPYMFDLDHSGAIDLGDYLQLVVNFDLTGG